MGAADVVPGVSGGTIAFIAGIYDELLESISSVNLSLITEFKNGGIPAVWKKINGNFLVVLLSGIAVSILSLAKLLTYAMHYYPIQLWSFFFGLIIASIWYVGKQIRHWHAGTILGLIAGALFVYWISVTPPMGSNSSYFFLFFAGAIAACAMILPGISGSFILLLLGAYATVITAVGNHDIITVGIVGLGAVTGLISFSKLLKYLLNRFPNTLIGILTGFLIGSLWKIWPWKTDEMLYVKGSGPTPREEVMGEFHSLTAYMKNQTTEKFEHVKAYVENNVLPQTYEHLNPVISAQILPAVIFCVLGFALIFIIEFIATRKNV